MADEKAWERFEMVGQWLERRWVSPGSYIWSAGLRLGGGIVSGTGDNPQAAIANAVSEAGSAVYAATFRD